jgi:aminoglycoside phosphotransferase (APT) family kinase protein
LVLIEDLVGARNGDQVAGCRFEEAALAVRGLAALHAGFWGDPSLAASEWLPTPNLTPGAIKANFRRSRRHYFELLGHLLPPHFSEAIEWVDSHLGAVLDRISGPPITLLHGDYRLDNLFFEGHQLRAIDWQIVSRGLGTWDLAYFVTTCLREEVDAREEQRLLELYHDELLDRGVTSYGRERCQRDYALCKIFAAYGGVASAESIDVDGERGEELMLVSRRRFFSRVPVGPYDALLGNA